MKPDFCYYYYFFNEEKALNHDLGTRGGNMERTAVSFRPHRVVMCEKPVQLCESQPRDEWRKPSGGIAAGGSDFLATALLLRGQGLTGLDARQPSAPFHPEFGVVGEGPVPSQ